MSVRRARVGTVLDLVRRQVRVDPGETYGEIGVRSFGRGIFHKSPTLGATLGNKRVFAIAEHDLVVSNVFAWEGAVALATEAETGLIGSHRFMTWVADPAETDVRYLLHYFTSSQGVDQLRRASPGSAGRNKTLGIKAFQDLVIPLPNLPEQQAISARLDRFAETERAIIKRRRDQALLTAALRRQLVTSLGNDREPIPLGVVLQEVRRDSTVDPQKAYSMLGVRSFGRGSFDAGVLRGDSTAYRRLRRVRAGDLVYPKLMAWEGAFAVVPAHLDGRYVSPEFCTFEMRLDRISGSYADHLFSDSEFLKRFATQATGTNVRRRRLQPEDFLALHLPVPSLDDQHRMVHRLDQVREIEKLGAQQQSLAEALPLAARSEVFSVLN